MRNLYVAAIAALLFVVGVMPASAQVQINSNGSGYGFGLPGLVRIEDEIRKDGTLVLRQIMTVEYSLDGGVTWKFGGYIRPNTNGLPPIAINPAFNVKLRFKIQVIPAGTPHITHRHNRVETFRDVKVSWSPNGFIEQNIPYGPSGAAAAAEQPLTAEGTYLIWNLGVNEPFVQPIDLRATGVVGKEKRSLTVVLFSFSMSSNPLEQQVSNYFELLFNRYFLPRGYGGFTAESYRRDLTDVMKWMYHSRKFAEQYGLQGDFNYGDFGSPGKSNDTANEEDALIRGADKVVATSDGRIKVLYFNSEKRIRVLAANSGGKRTSFIWRVYYPGKQMLEKKFKPVQGEIPVKAFGLEPITLVIWYLGAGNEMTGLKVNERGLVEENIPASKY